MSASASSSASLSVQFSNLSLSSPSFVVPVDTGTLSGPLDLDIGSPTGSLSGRPIDLGSLTNASSVSSPVGPVRARTGTLVAPVSMSQGAPLSISQAANPIPIPSIYTSASLLGSSHSALSGSSPLQQVAETVSALSVSVSQSQPAQQIYLPSEEESVVPEKLESKHVRHLSYSEMRDKKLSAKRASISKRASVSQGSASKPEPQDKKRAHAKKATISSDSDADLSDSDDEASASKGPKSSSSPAQSAEPDTSKQLILSYKRNNFANPKDLYEILDACNCDLSLVEECDHEIARNLEQALKALKHFDFFQLDVKSRRNDSEETAQNYYFVTQKRVAFVRKYCPQLESVNLANLRFTKGAYAAVNQLCVKELLMPMTLGSTAHQVRPEHIKGLEVLDISHNLCVNDTWLQGLRGCATLKVLKLPECRSVTGRGFEVIYNLEALRELHIGGLGYKVPYFEPERLRQVRVINLCGANVTDKQLPHFARVPALEVLQLPECNLITLEGVQELAKQKSRLREIDLRGSRGIEKEPAKIPFVVRKFVNSVQVRTFFDEPSTSLDRQDKLVSDILRRCPDFSSKTVLEVLPSRVTEMLGKAAPTITVLDLPQMQQTQANFDFFKTYFINLRTASFAKGSMSLDLLVKLGASLPKLEHLNVSGLGVAETETEHNLKLITRLKTFNSSHLKQLVQVKDFPQLRSLNLDETLVTSKAIRELRNERALANLQSLSLRLCSHLFESNEEEAQLLVPRELRVLHIAGTPGFTAEKRDALERHHKHLVIIEA